MCADKIIYSAAAARAAHKTQIISSNSQHAHTHTHTQIEKARERERESECKRDRLTDRQTARQSGPGLGKQMLAYASYA